MVIAIRGPRGTGKSNIAVHFARKDKNAGRMIVSTMKSLTFADKYMTLKELVEGWDNLWNCTILADEIQLAVDSRRSLSSRNVKLNQFFTQLRKRNIVFIFTTQFFEDIDVRLRRQIDYIYYMYNVFDDGKKSKHLFRYERFRRHDFDGLPDKVGEFNGKPFWKYYDTYEIQSYDEDDDSE